jgi:hypothetical protein
MVRGTEIERPLTKRCEIVASKCSSKPGEYANALAISTAALGGTRSGRAMFFLPHHQLAPQGA